MRKKILITLMCLIAILGVICGVHFQNIGNNETQNTALEENQITEIIVTEETQQIANETIEATEAGEDLSTTEEIESTHDEEQVLEEEDLEQDAQVEQENIAWERK